MTVCTSIPGMSVNPLSEIETCVLFRRADDVAGVALSWTSCQTKWIRAAKWWRYYPTEPYNTIKKNCYYTAQMIQNNTVIAGHCYYYYYSFYQLGLPLIRPRS